MYKKKKIKKKKIIRDAVDIDGVEVKMLDPRILEYDSTVECRKQSEKEVLEFVKSIKKYGFAKFRPIIVWYNSENGRYFPSAGWGRRVAAILCNLKEVPCLVTTSKIKALELAHIEDLSNDITPYVRIRATYNRFIGYISSGYSREDAYKLTALGKSTATVKKHVLIIENLEPESLITLKEPKERTKSDKATLVKLGVTPLLHRVYIPRAKPVSEEIVKVEFSSREIKREVEIALLSTKGISNNIIKPAIEKFIKNKEKDIKGIINRLYLSDSSTVGEGFDARIKFKKLTDYVTLDNFRVHYKCKDSPTVVIKIMQDFVDGKFVESSKYDELCEENKKLKEEIEAIYKKLRR